MEKGEGYDFKDKEATSKGCSSILNFMVQCKHLDTN